MYCVQYSCLFRSSGTTTIGYSILDYINKGNVDGDGDGGEGDDDVGGLLVVVVIVVGMVVVVAVSSTSAINSDINPMLDDVADPNNEDNNDADDFFDVGTTAGDDLDLENEDEQGDVNRLSINFTSTSDSSALSLSLSSSLSLQKREECGEEENSFSSTVIFVGSDL